MLIRRRMSGANVMRKLEQMLAELESNQLVTVLAPSKRGINPWDCVRVNVSESPRWYKRLCSAHASKRGVRRGRFDTVIRRQHALAALNRMLRGNFNGRYAERILEIMPGVKI